VAFSRYAWGTVATEPVPDVPLKPGPDPEHLHPTLDPRYDDMSPVWQDGTGTGVPTLPATYTADDGVAAIVAPGGPISQEPAGGAYGVGSGPGLTTDEAAAIRESWGNRDLGAPAEIRYVPATDRDGTPSVAIVQAEASPASPETLAYQVTGVNGTNDPGARRSSRIQRAWQRVWDMHWYDVEARPATLRNAQVAQSQPAVTHGNQYTSPWPTAATAYAVLQPDNFVGPQMRRVPDPWDQPLLTDGAVSGVSDQAQLWSM